MKRLLDFIKYDLSACLACLCLGFIFGLMLGYGTGVKWAPNHEGEYTINIDREIHTCYGREK